MRTISGAAAALPLTSLILADAALAQNSVAPAVPAAPVIMAPPPPPPPPPVILPTLSDQQARELADLIRRDAVAQGLRDTEVAPDTSSNNALVRAALDHARAVRTGRLDPSDFRKDWGLRPVAYDPLPAFADAVKRDRLAAWIASLPPPYAGYDGLQQALGTYRALEQSGGWSAISAGPDLSFGMSGPRVAEVRKRIAIEDKELAATGDKFDTALLEAVRRAQRRYGLNPSGLVSGQTLAALNVPVHARVRQIMANMERWRWLPPELPKDRIQVNIAAAVLTMFDGDAPVASMKAVTGRPGDETPMLQSSIHSIVLNPPWNVPQSIATKELWPKEKASPGYLKRNGFRVIPLDGGGRRLQQASGPSSALGRYKFDFDNNFAVYLHDTPAQAGFSRYSRLASHGCVRLEKPAELAERLLSNEPAWSGDAIETAVDAGKTVRARLTQPVAVYLLYWTAFASSTGPTSFRADPYEWDSLLADKIEARSARQSLAAR
nr:L,D-transpeptidase family protein [Sphingomonas laterariae]